MKDLGFTALYISPFVENTKGGYHGYWVKDIYKVNPEFGSEEDLKSLIKKAHAENILVMVDVVFNHVGYVPKGNDFSGITPFNEHKYYHEWCEITQEDFNTNNQANIEKCRLSGLPDLNTESEQVKQILFNWIEADVVLKYGFDGLRIDTVKHVNMRFWQELSIVLSRLQIFAIGEVMHSQAHYVADY